MSDSNKASTEFVKMETTETVATPPQKASNAKIFVLAAALLFSLASNVLMVYNPATVCPDTTSKALDNCLVSLEGSDDRIMNCLLQRAEEMTVREEAVGDCIAELKVTESELAMYKGDEEAHVDNMSIEDLKKDLN
jgi:hypothetical protein